MAGRGYVVRRLLDCLGAGATSRYLPPAALL